MDAAEVVDRLGGIASSDELRGAGVSRRRLAADLASGRLTRPRVGWYSTLPANHARFRAVRIGGRLTGASALFELGAWMLRPAKRLEVALPRGSARPRGESGAVLHWVADRAEPSSASIGGLPEALARVVLDHDLEVSAPCLDWALATGRLISFEFEQFLLALPAAARCIREWVDPRLQCVLESVARVRPMRAGWPVRSQVRVGDFEAIDLLVADFVALELDGRTHHEATFESDRRKDLRITSAGWHSLRVSYADARWRLGAVRARDRRGSGRTGSAARAAFSRFATGAAWIAAFARSRTHH